MTRSILNSLSTLEVVVLGVGGMVLVVVAAVLLLRRLLPDLADSQFEPIADGLRVVYELIFALILAFVIAAVLDEMGDAEATVASEATTIAQLVRGNEAFATVDKERLDATLRDSVRAVANDEWETMKDGNASPQAAARLDTVYAAYRQLHPRGPGQTENYSRALAKLDDVASERRERLNIAAADLPTFLRALVIVGLFLLFIIEYRPRLSRAAALVFMGTLAAVASSAFLLTVILNYPFAGDVSVSNTPLKRDTLARFWSQELAYRPEPGDTKRALTPRHLAGVWSSDAFGAVVMRCYRPATHTATPICLPGDNEMRGVYRDNQGTITGRFSHGVFRGWWAERPTRTAPADAGTFVWRLVERSDDHLIVGSYRHGTSGRLTPGWDLHEIGGAEPHDLKKAFERTSTFRHAPGRRRQ